MEFVALSLIAEIGAALAGFATLAGVVRRDQLDSDAIFGIVFNSLIAVLFAITAIIFVGPGGTGNQSLRVISAPLLLTSVVAISREFKVYRASWRNRPDLHVGGFGRVFGIASLAIMLLPPLLASLLLGGIYPARATLLFELAVFGHLAVAIFILLYVVWRNFALHPDRSSS